MFRASENFEQYLSAFRRRLVRLQLARASAISSIVLLVVTIAAVTLAIRSGFPSEQIVLGRIFLLVALVACVVLFGVLPIRRLRADGIAEIETRTPAFGGRVETWTSLDDETHPMRELLAEDTLDVARHFSPERQIAVRELSLPWVTSVTALALLICLAVVGPGNYSYGVRHFLAGWAVSGLLPPQRIVVQPGDQAIRRGASVRIVATVEGFEPGEATVHANFGDDEWQSVAMSDTSSAFEFTFFSIREPLSYYVTAADVRSPEYQVSVADLPEVQALKLTYYFPEWTGLAPETHDPGGDIRVPAGTEIELTVESDAPLPAAALVLNNESKTLRRDGNDASTRFTVEMDGQYFVAANMGAEQVRLTDDYFITVIEDGAPQVEFLRPGRDWKASNIEEVTTQVSVEDDYALESLELNYSVNGSEWQKVDLPAGGSDVTPEHIFFLESLGQEPGESQALVPGDLIAYYAVARDREQETSTDIFFIEVQAFDRRYTQSQQSGGMGGQSSQIGDEISERQREIIVSTWNLIREQSNPRRNDDSYIDDNASLLSELQDTLRAQTLSLAERARARQLSQDDDIARFVDHMEKAALSMQPAAERLAVVDFSKAIFPEQEALQHLLRAESVFRDIVVSTQQAGSRNAGGGQAGRDLAEMFEIEMDLEKNQYETGSVASNETERETQTLDEAAEKLKELAQRQEQLAKDLRRNNPPTARERWQQEMLRRETEELQQQLANRSGDNSGSAGGQSANADGNSDDSQDATRQGPEATEAQRDELQRRVDSAVRAMNQADQAMRNGANNEAAAEAAAEAQRQLSGASDHADEQRQQAIRETFADLSERANSLYEQQADVEQELLESVRDEMSYLQAMDLAAQKREMQAALQTLEQDIRGAARRLKNDEPRASEELDKGIEGIREYQVKERLAFAAAYIENGEAIYIVSSESMVTEAFRILSEKTERARAMANSGSNTRPEDSVRQALADTQRARRDLQALSRGSIGNAGVGDPLARLGPDDTSDGVAIPDVDNVELDRAIDAAARRVRAALRGVAADAVPPNLLTDIADLVRRLEATGLAKSTLIVDSEVRLALDLAEQLELKLLELVRGTDTNVRASNAAPIPEEHRDIIAEYYRRLGEAGGSDE